MEVMARCEDCGNPVLVETEFRGGAPVLCERCDVGRALDAQKEQGD